MLREFGIEIPSASDHVHVQRWLYETGDEVRFNGFGEVMVETGFAGGIPVLLLSPACHRDQENIAPTGARPNPARHFVSVHLRHADIQQRDLRSHLFKKTESGVTITGYDDVVSFESQECRKALRGISMIVRDKHTTAYHETGLAIFTTDYGGRPNCFTYWQTHDEDTPLPGSQTLCFDGPTVHFNQSFGKGKPYSQATLGMSSAFELKLTNCASKRNALSLSLPIAGEVVFSIHQRLPYAMSAPVGDGDPMAQKTPASRRLLSNGKIDKLAQHLQQLEHREFAYETDCRGQAFCTTAFSNDAELMRMQLDQICRGLELIRAEIAHLDPLSLASSDSDHPCKHARRHSTGNYFINELAHFLAGIGRSSSAGFGFPKARTF